jgi:hypothetical protein
VSKKKRFGGERTSLTYNPEDFQKHPEPVPCYFFAVCKAPSVACKHGKSMCRRHLDESKPGVEYPLRQVETNPLIRMIDYMLESRAANWLS